MNSLTRLDDIMVTHEHDDHLWLPFVQALVAKFPDARITTTAGGAAKLKAGGIPHAETTGSAEVELFAAEHESLDPLGVAPQNTGIHYLGQLSHPGDCQHFAESKAILALPLTAPWGTLMRAAALGAELKPKAIIPIHDWHLNDAARAKAYGQLEAFFAEKGIHFIKPTDGSPVEL